MVVGEGRAQRYMVEHAEYGGQGQHGPERQFDPAHISAGRTASSKALKRISPARLMRSDSQPIGHWDSRPAVTAVATNTAAWDVLMPCLAP